MDRWDGSGWVGWEGEEEEEDKHPYRHFGVAVATYSVATRLLPCQGEVHRAVSGHGSPTGVLQRYHSLNHDITCT